MTTQRKPKPSVRSTVLSAILAAGVAMTPAIGMAKNTDAKGHQAGGHQGNYSSHSEHSHGKAGNAGKFRSENHIARRVHDAFDGRHHRKEFYRVEKRAHRKHHDHDYRYVDYPRVRYIVKDHYHVSPYYDIYDPFRLSIGLHTDNFDIILRD